ncbi:MAG: hypothetical protein KBS60_01325 [Phascolarctobacterium sp.]|nr:hypothetical protein [Candidatus Phascolarctobacterium caballi]
MSKWVEIREDAFIKFEKITGLELTPLGDLFVVVEGRCYIVKEKATRKDLLDWKKKLEKEK